MSIFLTDVTVHIDEDLNTQRRAEIQDRIRSMDGVISVHNPDNRPHLSVIGYDPDAATSSGILQTIRAQGVHAELIGL